MQRHATNQDLVKHIEQFENDYPELAEAVKLMGNSIEEYNRLLINMASNEIVTTNNTKGD